MRSLTHSWMMAFSGNQQTAPMMPVKVSRFRGVCAGYGDVWSLETATASAREGTGIMEDSASSRKRDIVPHGYPGTQGSDCQAPRATRGVSLFQRSRRNHLRGQ